MAVTQAEIARLKSAWRALARAALRFAAEPVGGIDDLKDRARDALKWLSPLDAAEDAFVLFGFARLCTALARTRLADVPDRAGALSVTAELVLRLVGAEDPPPPQLPFRADIDG